MAGYTRSTRAVDVLGDGIPPSEALVVSTAGNYLIWLRDDAAAGVLYLDSGLHEIHAKRVQTEGGADITEGDVVALY
jgi:hypothetical protein